MSRRYDKKQIGELVAKINELQLSYADGAKEFNIPIRHIYRYNNEINGENESSTAGVLSQAVAEPSVETENKKTSSSSLPTEIQTIIVKYRKEHAEHGYQRIEDYLRDRHFVKVSRKEIRKVLKAHGLEKRLDSSFDKTEQPVKGTRRFEAGCPLELFQMDLSYVYITGLPVFYLILIIDDYSRFIVGHELVSNQKSLTMINSLHRCIERYGKPQKLLTDQSGSFYTWSFEPTLFQKYLDDVKIEHIVCDPHSPQTQGKVERMTQTIQKELLHKIRFKSYEHGQSEIDAYI
ncbi:MAG: DDE-type integrase/transposase/recombinase, partial [Methanosarcinaceae archaeon]